MLFSTILIWSFYQELKFVQVLNWTHLTLLHIPLNLTPIHENINAFAVTVFQSQNYDSLIRFCSMYFPHDSSALNLVLLIHLRDGYLSQLCLFVEIIGAIGNCTSIFDVNDQIWYYWFTPATFSPTLVSLSPYFSYSYFFVAIKHHDWPWGENKIKRVRIY